MLAVGLAVAVTGVVNFGHVLGDEGDETKTVGDEFVGEDGRVRFDFDEVDGHGRDFGEDDAADGVGKGEVDVGELEINAEIVVLERAVSIIAWEAHEAVRRRVKAQRW